MQYEHFLVFSVILFHGGFNLFSGVRYFGKRIDANGIADIIIAQ